MPTRCEPWPGNTSAVFIAGYVARPRHMGKRLTSAFDRALRRTAPRTAATCAVWPHLRMIPKRDRAGHEDLRASDEHVHAQGLDDACGKQHAVRAGRGRL